MVYTVEVTNKEKTHEVLQEKGEFSLSTLNRTIALSFIIFSKLIELQVSNALSAFHYHSSFIFLEIQSPAILSYNTNYR